MLLRFNRVVWASVMPVCDWPTVASSVRLLRGLKQDGPTDPAFQMSRQIQ
jgi:hypothetical protein